MKRKKPRQYSFVTFNDGGYQYKEYPELGKKHIYLGEIPNMSGHCIVLDPKTNAFHVGYHIENWEEVDEEDL